MIAATELPRPLAGATASIFRGLSALRGKRIFHPRGVGFAATLTPLHPAPRGVGLLADPIPRPAIVRLSRSAGLPEPLPDALGLALRIPDAYGAGCHQDLLLVTSGARSPAHHLLLPARGFLGGWYSSLLPYRVGGSLALIGARAEGDITFPGPGLAELRRRRFAGLRFRLALTSLGGAWEHVATLDIQERLPDEEVEALRFDPANTGGGLELAGLLNRIRRPAYRASQQGRGARSDSPRRVGVLGQAANHWRNHG